MDAMGSLVLEFDLKNYSLKQINPHELAIDTHDRSKVYWVHSDLNEHDTFAMLVQKLQLPEDVIDLCSQKDTMPKLIDEDESLTMQIQCFGNTELQQGKNPEFTNMIIYLTHQFCFTATTEPTLALINFMKTCRKSLRYAKTPCFILFLILDDIINDYAKVLFNFELVTEQLDTRIHSTSNNMYHDVMDVKLEVMRIKRYAMAMREILMRVSGRKISVVSDQCRASLYNLSNHTHMIVNESDSIRDMLNGLLDSIENTLMQKLNETMRVLTAFAAIFLPLTLITGIYGMNFHWMPELSWKYGYFYALGIILLSAISLLLLFKIKKWF